MDIEKEAVTKFITSQFDYDKLSYTNLDFRGATVATKSQVDQLSVELIKSLNNLQLIYGGVSAIGIAIGFLMLNTGSISVKNTQTMLRVSLIENMICAFGIWALGYRISMNSIGGMIGTGLDFDLFHTVDGEDAIQYIVLFACAQFTSSITTGALAERTYVDTQIAFKVMLNVLIFPIIAAWVWGGGWLSKYGYQDFGGSGFHIVGGTCGLVGANFLGPRLGLFSDSLPNAENKIREKLEGKEHSFQNLRQDYHAQIKQLRRYIAKYLKQSQRPEYQWIKEQQYGMDIIDHTVNDIHKKVFVSNSQIDQRNLRHGLTPSFDFSPNIRHKSFHRSNFLPHQNQVRKRRSIRSNSEDNKNVSRQKAPSQKAILLKNKNSQQSNSSSNNSSQQVDDLQYALDNKETLTSYFLSLPSGQRNLIKNIINLDNKLRKLGLKLREELLNIERLREKYVNAFRSRNPDLRHFNIEQIKDYTDLLIKESQNLRQPNSVVLVSGGVLFIFFGTFSLSILITRVFYKEFQINGETPEEYLDQAHRLMEIGFDSMIDKLASVSGSVISVLLLKPLIYGHWRTNEQTSCVYNVETISSSIIAGIASVAGASGSIEIHSAVIIGAVGGIIYLLANILLNRYQLDDPLQATQTHLFCGLWGVIAFGLVHKENGLLTQGKAEFLGIQLLGATVIFLFSFTLTYTFFKLVTKRFHLRLSKVEEILGLDCQEDEFRMQTYVQTYLNEQTRENIARLTLINLVKSGNHVSKKKKRSSESQHQHFAYQDSDFVENSYGIRRQNNLWKSQRTLFSQSMATSGMSQDGTTKTSSKQQQR